MQIENIASPPPAQTPQLRYASLHRAIEKGLASDDIWNELARICLALGFNDEAVKAYQQVQGTHTRRYLEVLLARHGLISTTETSYRSPVVHQGRPGTAHPRTRSMSGDHPQRLQQPQPSQQSHHPQAVDSEPRSGFREQLADAFQLLFMDHMPLTVIVATLTFPLVVGLGGFLTAGSPFFLLPAIALLPALSVLGVVGAMGRRLLIEASQGMHDAPPVPELRALSREAQRFLLDMLVLCAVFLGPGTAMFLLSAHLGSAVGSTALGMVLLPMAVLIRQLTDDWRALAPETLFRAVSRGGTQYLGMTLIISAMMLPAFLSAVVTMGSHFYLQISVIGPLLVVPLFVTCRLLGGFFHVHHDKLADLVASGRSPAPRARVESPSTFRLKRQSPTPSSGARRAARSRPARQPLGAPSHPESRIRTSKPRFRRPVTRSQLKNPPRRPTPMVARTAGLPGIAGTAINGRRAAIPPVPQPVLSRRKTGLDDQPDLSNIPGARIIKGEDRERSGAAALGRRRR